MAVFMILLGSVYVSLSFVVLLNVLELSAHEKLALSLIEKVKYQKQIKNSAAKIISLMFRINYLTAGKGKKSF